MNQVATAAVLLSLVTCIAACGLSNRSHGIDTTTAVAVARPAHSSVAARKSSRAQRPKVGRTDAERLRAANTLAVLQVGMAGLSLPARD